MMIIKINTKIKTMLLFYFLLLIGCFGCAFVHTKYARVEANFFDVEYIACDGGEIVGQTHQMISSKSKCQAVIAVANDGYVFCEWSDGNYNEKREDINITSNHTFFAKFTKKQKINVSYRLQDAKYGNFLLGTNKIDVSRYVNPLVDIYIKYDENRVQVITLSGYSGDLPFVFVQPISDLDNLQKIGLETHFLCWTKENDSSYSNTINQRKDFASCTYIADFEVYSKITYEFNKKYGSVNLVKIDGSVLDISYGDKLNSELSFVSVSAKVGSRVFVRAYNVLGYAFSIWMGNETKLNDKPSRNDVVIDKQNVFCANFERQKYTVTFLVCGEKGTSGQISCDGLNAMEAIQNVIYGQDAKGISFVADLGYTFYKMEIVYIDFDKTLIKYDEDIGSSYIEKSVICNIFVIIYFKKVGEI